jgi:hypothetical protein
MGQINEKKIQRKKWKSFCKASLFFVGGAASGLVNRLFKLIRGGLFLFINGFSGRDDGRRIRCTQPNSLVHQNKFKLI